MTRLARIVVPGLPHHVTQRGNRREAIFFEDGDQEVYRDLLAEQARRAGVEVWAYCLMPNHVHLVAAPSRPEALAEAVGATHVRYTRRINSRERWTGYLWQGRFASFPMDEDYLLACARYIGLNPVRAGLTARAIDWPWSSVRAHLGAADPLLTPGPLAERLARRAPCFFDLDVEEEARRRLRRAALTGRPLGAAAWIKALEASTGRRLADPPRGRPPRSEAVSTAQASLFS